MEKDLSTKKAELRKDISLLKSEFTSTQLIDKSQSIISSLESLPAFQRAKHIFVYNSMPDEVCTKQFIDKWRTSKQLYLPVIDACDMHIRQLTADTQFVLSKFGIDEPQGDNVTQCDIIDLVIVPGVAFDAQLNRLGRGKGYYDRFLNQKHLVKIGLGFDFQLVDTIPIQDNDIPMDFVITESQIYSIKR